MQLKLPYVPDVYGGEWPVNWALMNNPKPLRAILKASGKYLDESGVYRDSHVIDYTQQCRDLGFKTGLYHFLVPHDIQQQVDMFVSTWDVVMGSDMMPIVDVEVVADNYGVGRFAWASQVYDFVSQIEDKLGLSPMIYTSQFYWSFLCTLDITRNLVAPAWMDEEKYPLWLAWYPDYPDKWVAPLPNSLPLGWSDWAIWQYSEKGRTIGYLVNDINTVNHWFIEKLNQFETSGFVVKLEELSININQRSFQND